MTVVCSYASLLQQFPKRRLDRSLHALLQKQAVLCLFSFAFPARLRCRSTQCSFAAKEDALLWSVSVDDQPILPSATLCVEEGKAFLWSSCLCVEEGKAFLWSCCLCVKDGRVLLWSCRLCSVGRLGRLDRAVRSFGW